MFKKWFSKIFNIGANKDSSITSSDDLNWSPESIIPHSEESQVTEADFEERRSKSD
ncbi:MAG: hypothetical protein ACJZ17_02505 [Acidimicrobiales bacterium]|tara:strand:+ start:6415 stop:6582 length:168 start_codon:yes stop_codon:yes gene_type:complete